MIVYGKKYIILVSIIVLAYSSLIYISLFKHDNYVNELEKKVQKYEMIENEVGGTE